ncbi:MerR family transcriptional regulator [Actinoplanes couchii]|uniref:MerR family transcriptional regulator n=1 Tax=Actinoplanes couchii TaxID=403638 RepID=A0ABQ3XNU3_9ACTN|nr:MerR family transcriptional regulator [Actinoplanes couchii]MDR6319683.1 DNA-binding transcriptional MerR regulator [Actinoplanes couchii]GID60097.1 MerR family transcriptional regulator [Actinoplanes couchii]
MRIGELSERTGVSTRSLRYYEQQGLLSSERSSGGHRNYTEHEVDRVNYLQGLYTAGLNSQVILEVLPCLESPSDETSDAAFGRLVEVRDKLRTDIAGLNRTLRSLDELITYNRARRNGSPSTPGQPLEA